MVDEQDPLAVFRDWYASACRSGIAKPHAMSLSTAGEDGRPAARMVLMSSFDERGFVFHTNRLSRKGREIGHMPWVALLFWWDSMGYQVRIEGAAQVTTPEESDIYFSQRPRGSQLSAWAAEQSRVVDSRAELENRVAAFERQYADQDVPRPPHWGGYRVYPRAMEFWVSRENRLHERVRYQRDGDGSWVRELLAP